MTSVKHEQSAKSEQEGVIKYHLEFASKPIVHPRLVEKLALLNAARAQLKACALLGQDPARYGGDGFGNISLRLDDRQFLISGSQTGHLQGLSAADIALVDGFDCRANQLSAYGLSKPSSEAMTHGVAYRTLAAAGAVVHVHSPAIWQQAGRLGLPATASEIPYGTPEMAEAVRQLLLTQRSGLPADNSQAAGEPEFKAIVFVMQGHEDGVVAVGANLADCTRSLLDCLALSAKVFGKN